MNDKRHLTVQKYKLLKRLRANDYETEDDRKGDLLRLRAVMAYIEPQRRSRNDRETKKLLSELPPDEPNPRYESQARGWMCVEKKEEHSEHKQKKKGKKRQMMYSNGGLFW